MQLQSSESYADAALKLHSGPSTWYNDKGIVVHVNTYTDNKLSLASYFFDNGSKKGVVNYNSQSSIKKQIGWEENGTEIPN